MLDGLAFLPVGDVTAGMECLNRIAMLEAAGLVDYFDSTYVNGAYLQLQQRRLRPRFPPPVWNVHEATINGTPRTNNQCEGWNNKFVHLVGHNHPSVFKCGFNCAARNRTFGYSAEEKCIHTTTDSAPKLMQ